MMTWLPRLLALLLAAVVFAALDTAGVPVTAEHRATFTAWLESTITGLGLVAFVGSYAGGHRLFSRLLNPADVAKSDLGPTAPPVPPETGHHV
jgi:hypothetical protein